MNIYINNGEKIPDDETCYIIAKDGIYLKKKLDLIESLTKVDKISFLEDMPQFAKVHIPKIPEKMISEIVSFFKEVYKLYRSECIVLLFYNKNKKIYKIYVPEQTVSCASLKYEANKTIKEFQLVGTIHSHGSMTAFHSSVDDKDEKNFDGIHITIGKVNEGEIFDISASVVVNGFRSQCLPNDYINGIEVVEYTNYFPSMFRPNFEIDDFGEKNYKNIVKTNFGYKLSDQSNLSFNEKWLEKVKEIKYQYSNDAIKRYVFVDGVLVPDPNFKKSEEDNKLDFSDFHKQYNKDTDDKDDLDPCSTCIFRKKKSIEDRFSWWD